MRDTVYSVSMQTAKLQTVRIQSKWTTYYIRLGIEEFNDGMSATDWHVIWYKNVTVTTTNCVRTINEEMKCRLCASQQL